MSAKAGRARQGRRLAQIGMRGRRQGWLQLLCCGCVSQPQGRLASRSLASVWSAAAGPKSADLAGLGWSSPRRRARRRRRKERNLDVQAVDRRHASCECAETRGVSAREAWSSGQICHAASGGRRAGRAASRARTGPPGSAGGPGWNSTRTWQALPSSCPASSWSAAGRLPAKPSTWRSVNRDLCGKSPKLVAPAVCR